jgi:hypothetical protein
MLNENVKLRTPGVLADELNHRARFSDTGQGLKRGKLGKIMEALM